MRRTTRTDPKKRHSMIVDTSGISSFAGFSSLYGSKTTNRSLENVATDKKSGSGERLERTKRKNSSLKRSTVLLDDNMVREYNLAVQSLAHEPLDSRSSPQLRKTPQRTHQNTLSASSSMSSLFSRESAMSVQDLMFEDYTVCEPVECVQKGFFTGSSESLDLDLDLDLDPWAQDKNNGNYDDNNDDFNADMIPSRRTQLDFF
ncbi:LAFA_0D04170g1_1 [Lachancea sp. 'fantastica']|nr:LAFA_0D04170g1_1 [Lachancea sp. 'fantastica']